MATEILDRPESALRRAAFAHVIAEVIRADGDEPVLRAIAAAPNLKAAKVIRATAEAACESISVVVDGAEREAGQFSAAMVVRFPEAITTQEFEDGLATVSWSTPFLARLRDCGTRHGISFILPHVFVFEDLAQLSLCSVRNAAIMASANHGRSNRGPITPFPTTEPAQRRSATFLRYLVGYQTRDHRMPEQTALGRARFRDCVRSVMKASMPEAQEIAVIYTERFYDPIWQGLWAYHTHRLAEVVRTIAAREAAPIGISASITMVGSRHQMAAHVAFRCRGVAARHDVYSLPIRPLENPRIVAGRFAAELRTLGVKLAADAPRRGTRRDGGRLMASPCRAHRQFTQFGLRLPL